MNTTSFRIAAAAVLALACPPLFAHPGHGSALLDGLLHPYAGIDHLLGALAVGLWASRQNRTVALALPAAFLLSLMCGTMLGAAGYAPAWLEQGIAMSLMAAGLLMAFAVHLSLRPAVAFASCSALLHGLAHGAEMAAPASVPAFGTGMTLGTALLLFASMSVGFRLTNRVHVLRLAGASATIAGLALSLRVL